MKKLNPTIKYYLLCGIQGLVGIAPLVIYVFVNFDTFFGNKNTCVSNAIGLGIACAFIAMIFTKQTKILKGIGGFVVFAIIVTLLRTIISQLYFICWLAVLGMCLSKIVNIFTEKAKNEKDAEPQMKAIEKQTEAITQAINGRG